MARQPLLSDVRRDLERHLRDFTRNQECALGVLRSEWGGLYVIDVDGAGLWWALRPDGQIGVSGCGPDELAIAIAADFAAKPVIP